MKLILFFTQLLLIKARRMCNCIEVPESSKNFQFKSNDFECLNDTTFRHYTSPTTFILNNCPPGLCFTRIPPNKNPCIGKELAQKLDS